MINPTMAQLARQESFDAVQREFSPFLQAAGLPVIAGDAFDTPEQYRSGMLKMLQKALPESTSMALRADASVLQHNAPEAFAKIERHVKAVTIETARAGSELRPIVERDITGRESTSFYGPKAQWMGQFRDKPRLMVGLGGEPFGDG
ncbi:hypothetical protein [Paraburkholderia sp. GAS348]|uniref:hypothetical protein n=1 Tax=Paraburkholderia sp. GAS348 TaxID=3035132 RepID=UPI003D255BB0